MNPEQQKLSIKEKVGYSVGDTASNIFFQTFILFITTSFYSSLSFIRMFLVLPPKQWEPCF